MKLEMTYMPATGVQVSERLFGGNTLYSKNDLTLGDSFDEAVGQLGVNGLRYPGGTMTEEWGADFYADPNSLSKSFESAYTFVGLDDFLSYAVTTDQPATIVLPTRHLLLGEANGPDTRALDADAIEDVAQFVRNLMSNTQGADIAALEVGNEYWSDPVGMTSAEYGLVADAVSVAIQDVLDELGIAPEDQPQILVQMGGTFGRDFDTGGAYAELSLAWGEKVTLANSDVLGGLSDAAKTAIDGVVEHYYYVETDDALTLGDSAFSQADRFFREITWDWDQWRAAFDPATYGALELFVTEWGPHWEAEEQWGLKGAAVALEMFEGLLRLGVDGAHVWPIEMDGSVDFAGSHTDRDGDNVDKLTAQGEAFRLMAEHTIGLDLVDNGFDAVDAAIESVEVNAFASQERFVVFLSSRDADAQEVQLDVSAYVTGFESVMGELIHLIEPEAGVDEARWFATTSQVSAAELGNSTLIDVTIEPYEVLMVEFTLGADDLATSANRIVIQGEMDSDEITGTSGSDDIRGLGGDDVIAGLGGDDLIHGNSGGDVIEGGSGDDAIKGRLGADEIWGGDGDDDLRGNRGNDVIYGERGDDLLKGCRGEDWLWGGLGDDTLIGGKGDDVLGGGPGHDVLTGGEGADRFVFKGLGANRVTDFAVGEDVVDLAALATDFAALTIEDTDGGARLDYGEGTVLFEGVNAADLTEDQFLF